MTAPLAILALAAVVALLLGVGARSGRSMGLEEWTVGGRHFGFILVFLLLAGEIYTTFTFLGASGFAYGLGAPAYYILCYGTLAYIIGYFMLPPVWAYAKQHGLVSQPDFFARKYDSPALGVLVTLVDIVALVPYLVLQLTGLGIIVTAAGYGAIDANLAVWIGAVVVTVYVIVSGIRGSAWTAVVKDVLILAVIVFLGVYLPLHLHGGIGAMFSAIAEARPGFLTFPAHGQSVWWFVSTVLLTALGFFSWPHAIAACYTARDPGTFRKNAIVLPLYQLILLFAYFIGFAAVLHVPGLSGAQTNLALFKLVVQEMPPWVVGIIGAAGVFTALVPGSVLVITTATLIARNLYGVVAAARRGRRDRHRGEAAGAGGDAGRSPFRARPQRDDRGAAACRLQLRDPAVPRPGREPAAPAARHAERRLRRHPRRRRHRGAAHLHAHHHGEPVPVPARRRQRPERRHHRAGAQRRGVRGRERGQPGMINGLGACRAQPASASSRSSPSEARSSATGSACMSSDLIQHLRVATAGAAGLALDEPAVAGDRLQHQCLRLAALDADRAHMVPRSRAQPTMQIARAAGRAARADHAGDRRRPADRAAAAPGQQRERRRRQRGCRRREPHLQRGDDEQRRTGLARRHLRAQAGSCEALQRIGVAPAQRRHDGARRIGQQARVDAREDFAEPVTPRGVARGRLGRKRRRARRARLRKRVVGHRRGPLPRHRCVLRAREGRHEAQPVRHRMAFGQRIEPRRAPREQVRRVGQEDRRQPMHALRRIADPRAHHALRGRLGAAVRRAHRSPRAIARSHLRWCRHAQPAVTLPRIIPRTVPRTHSDA